jgi:hypothetical protein
LAPFHVGPDAMVITVPLNFHYVGTRAANVAP